MRHFSGEFEGVRLLMADELDRIAGGEGEDTDEVPEGTLPTVHVNGRADPSLGLLAGAAAGQAGRMILDLFAGAIGGAAGNELFDATSAEKQVAATFDPNQIAREVSGLDSNGNQIKGWQMMDNSYFWDTNGNNIVDQHMWTDRVGNVWLNSGNGPQMIKSAG